MYASIALTALLLASVTGSPLAQPLSLDHVEGNTFAIRAEGDDYYTEISFTNRKVNYGSLSVGEAIKKALGPACTLAIGDCDESAGSLVQETKVFKDENNVPSNGKLTFTPDTSFGINMGGRLVEAVAAVGDKAATKEKKSWAEADTSSPCLRLGFCEGEKGSGTFYKGPSSITLKRKKGKEPSQTALLIDDFQFSVELDVEDDEATSWCEVAGLAESIAGIFSGALAATFGLASFLGC